jgi:hypothetical protein
MRAAKMSARVDHACKLLCGRHRDQRAGRCVVVVLDGGQPEFVTHPGLAHQRRAARAVAVDLRALLG